MGGDGSDGRLAIICEVTVRGGSHLGMEAEADNYLMDPSSAQNSNEIVAASP